MGVLSGDATRCLLVLRLKTGYLHANAIRPSAECSSQRKCAERQRSPVASSLCKTLATAYSPSTVERGLTISIPVCLYDSL